MHSTENATVSVYLPTHNRSEMAKRAIQSVLDQTYSPIEIIVSDDGSEIQSANDLSAWCDTRRIQYVRSEQPQGACAARNAAIALATGQYITGLDDDDEFTPNRIATLLQHYDPRYAFVASSYMEIGSDHQTARTFDHGVISLDQLLHYNKVGNQIFTETSRLKKVGGFDENLPAMQDYELWIRMTQAFGPALKLKDLSYLLHVAHEGDRISSNPSKLTAAMDYLQKKHASLLHNRHLASHRLLMMRESGKKLSIVQCIKMINKGNYKLALSYLRHSLTQT